MAFWCESGVGPRHQHETIEEMKTAHTVGVTDWRTSRSKGRSFDTGIPVPSEPDRRLGADSSGPTGTVAVASPPAPVETYAERYARLERERQDRINEAGAQDEDRRPFHDPRLKLLKGMIDLIPDGYYATQEDDTSPVNFVRVSRPNRGKFNGHVKVQTQHSENWVNRLSLMPDGNWLVMHGGPQTISMLMLVVADYRTCALRYAIEIQTCWVCNTALTDDESRHYLIGPICDKKPQGLSWIEKVDNEYNIGLSYDALVARGLPTRVWQDRWVADR